MRNKSSGESTEVSRVLGEGFCEGEKRLKVVKIRVNKVVGCVLCRVLERI